VSRSCGALPPDRLGKKIQQEHLSNLLGWLRALLILLAGSGCPGAVFREPTWSGFVVKKAELQNA
jgi:hypothetical protein